MNEKSTGPANKAGRVTTVRAVPGIASSCNAAKSSNTPKLDPPQSYDGVQRTTHPANFCRPPSLTGGGIFVELP